MGSCCGKNREKYSKIFLVDGEGDYRLAKIVSSYQYLLSAGKLKPADRMLPSIFLGLVPKRESMEAWTKFWDDCKDVGISHYIYL